MTNIAKLAFTALAREAAAGTAETTIDMYVPVTKSTWSRKTKYVYSSEERGTRDGNNQRVGTVRMSSGDIGGELYINSIPYILLGFMGGIASTQPDNVNAATAYSHALTLADTPPSFTFIKGYDHTGYSFAYAVVAKVKIKFDANAKLLEWEANVESQYGTKIAGGTFSGYTPTYADVDAFAGYAPTISIDSVASDVVESMEIDLEQKISLSYTARGNRGFYKVDFGERTAQISFQARFDDSTFADDFDAEADHELEVEFDGANLGGAIVEKVYFDFPIVGYDEMDVDSSKEASTVKAKATARPGTTKNSLFTATVVNEVASYAAA
jgi:hypothetical protein